MVPVLLAAGLGRRLGGHAKALYPVAGAPLMARAARVLAGAGFAEILVITGHERDQVVAAARSPDFPLSARFVHNERFAELNNFHTVGLACVATGGQPVLLLNSDIIFTLEVITQTVNVDGDSVLAVDDSQVDDEAMGVRVVDGHATELSKHIPSAQAVGEFVGASVLGGSAKERYVAQSEAAQRAGETGLYYEDIFTRLAVGEPLSVARVPRSSWAEIDVPEDVPRALEVARAQEADARLARA